MDIRSKQAKSLVLPAALAGLLWFGYLLAPNPEMALASKKDSEKIGAPPQVPTGPKVAWTYQGKRRKASAEEISKWVKDLGDSSFKVRESASKALVEVGQPAVKNLKEVASTGELEVQKRAKSLLDRIEVHEALAPTLIEVKLLDTPVPDAVAAVSKQSKIKLEVVPQQGPARQQLEQRKIKLELNAVPFWEALDLLCQEAGLTYFSLGQTTIQLQMAEGKAIRPPTALTGPFRMRITGMNYFRGLNLIGNQQVGGIQPIGGILPAQGAIRTENLSVNLDMLAEPHVAILNMGGLQVTEAQDENGQSLMTQSVASTSPYNPYYGGGPSVMQLRQTQFNLRPATKPAANLQILRGTIPVEILVQRKALVTVSDIFSAKTKIFKGDGDLVLAVLQVQDHGGGRNGNIRFFLTGVEGITNNPGFPNQNLNLFQQRFEVTDAQGRRLNANINLNYTGNNERDRAVEGNIYFTSPQDVGPAVRLTYNNQKTIRTSVPFEFRNVPMP